MRGRTLVKVISEKEIDGTGVGREGGKGEQVIEIDDRV